MRIGIVPALSHIGGVFQYSLTMVRTLYQCQSERYEDEFIVFAHDVHHPAIAFIKRPDWIVKQLTPFSLAQWGANIARHTFNKLKSVESSEEGGSRASMKFPNPDVIKHRSDMARWFHRFGVELMLYPASNSLSFETGIPYVAAIHDLQHRLHPEFPEVSANGEQERREHGLRNVARYATLLLVDSEVGKEDVLNFYSSYGITADRVRVLPFLPALHVPVILPESERQRVHTTYCLPERYLFYPAQFWPHKNHSVVVQALAMIREQHHIKIPIAFCGSHAGEILEHTFHQVMSLASELGLKEEVHYLGYVPDKDMAALYASAVALVMPTFFGPTNIPVLEAWALGCPAITSDIRGVREQVGDAAILVDPSSAEAIAKAIIRIWTDDALRRDLASRGQQRLANYTPDDYTRRLIEILEEAKARVHSQKC